MEVDLKQVVSNIKKGIYRYIGSGSGRIVFDLNNGTVVKVSARGRGIAQNRAEYLISSANSSELFAKVLFISEDFRFLIMEKAEKIRDISFVWKYFNVKNSRELKENSKLKEIAEKHDLLLSDFVRAVNWGKIGDKPVIVDYGFTKSVKRRYY